MTKFLHVFLCVILLLGLFSCNKDDEPTRNLAQTGDATDITAFTAKVSGCCNQKNVAGLSVTYGIEYTNTDLTRNAIVLNASEFDEKGRFTIDIENLNPVTEYFYRTFVIYNRAYSFGEVKSFTTLAHSEPEKIDLGVGIKWASFNIGASSPAEFGKYYAWGETKPKSFYSWGTYAWCKDGQELQLTKYVPTSAPEYWFGEGPVDNKTVLDPNDDVACKELGDSWRMPTIEEFGDLVLECFWQWCTDYKGSGVRGYVVFKAKCPEDRGKRVSPEYTKDIVIGDYSIDQDVHIFLPAAGFRWDDVTMGDKGDVVLGYYRSSSLQAVGIPNYAGGTPNYAVDMCFSVFYTDTADYYERCFAMPIRAVAKD